MLSLHFGIKMEFAQCAGMELMMSSNIVLYFYFLLRLRIGGRRQAGLEAGNIFLLGFCIAERATKGMFFSDVTLRTTVNT